MYLDTGRSCDHDTLPEPFTVNDPSADLVVHALNQLKITQKYSSEAADIVIVRGTPVPVIVRGPPVPVHRGQRPLV